MPRQPVINKPTLRKPAIRKHKKTKRKTIVRKAKAKTNKATVRKPTQRLDPLDKLEARVSTMSNDHKITIATLKRVAALQEKSNARIDRDFEHLKKVFDRISADRDKDRKLEKEREAKREKEEAKREKEMEKREAKREKDRVDIDKVLDSVVELRKSIGGLEGRWGEFSEALLIGEVENALNEIEGVSVTSRHPNVRIPYEGKVWEIDCIVLGEDMVVVLEAKASLTKGHVGKFIGNILKRFTAMAPEYRGKKIYGAVGYINSRNDAVGFAQSKGLLVLRSIHKTKEVVRMPSKFKLRNYHP